MLGKILILHLGAQKTGTTSLQKFLCYNSQTLSQKYDIIYPVKELHPEKESFKILEWGHHLIDDYFLNPNNPKKKERSIKAFNNLKRLIEFGLKSHQILLLSCEHFLINPNYKYLINFFRNYFDQIIGIVYVRRQDESAPALYSTVVSVHNIKKTFEDWFEINKRLFDYYQLIKNYESCGVRIIVKLYHKNFLKNGDIIHDFLNCLSVITNKEINIEDFNWDHSYKENITFPDFITMILQYFNNMYNNKDIASYLKRIGRYIANNFKDLPKYDFLSPQEKSKIIKMYYHSNISLCKEYFNNDEQILNLLTNSHYTKEDIDNWNKRCGYEGWFWYEFFKYLDDLISKRWQQ